MRGMRSRLHRRSRWALAVLGLGLFGLSPLANSTRAAAPQALDADTATAAYLLNFLRFTYWSADAKTPAADAPYVIGVSGDRALLDALIRLVEGQKVRTHAVQVIWIKSVSDLKACHLVYLSPTLDSEGLGVPIADALSALHGKTILSVSPAPEFLSTGGLVQLFKEENRLRFAIDATAATGVGLTIDSRLLTLARPVPPRP